VFEFWRVWLLILCAGFVAGGSAMALLAGSRAMTVMDRIVSSGKPAADEATQSVIHWMTAVTGAVMAGWGLTLAFLVANAYSSRQLWVWWAIAGAVALWYPLDTGRSLYHRIYANVALNTVLLAGAAIPLLATFR
jgi:hypothetical protein